MPFDLDFRSNLIVDQNNPILIQKAWRDHDIDGWAYLSARYGEDALTQNVFRSLDVHRRLLHAQTFFSLEDPIEEVLFWGCDPDGHSDIQQRLNILIRQLDGRRKGTMTEIDLVFITRREVCFVECKLHCSREPFSARGDGWRKRCEDYRTLGGFKKALPKNPPDEPFRAIYQLVRTAIYAELLRADLNKQKARVHALLSHARCDKFPEIRERYKQFSEVCPFVNIGHIGYWEDLPNFEPGITKKLKEALLPP